MESIFKESAVDFLPVTLQDAASTAAAKIIQFSFTIRFIVNYLGSV
jgi:hypothetical protein